jgi:AcrR family transcriptional regulator
LEHARVKKLNKHSSATTIARILNSARDAFAEHGFDGTRLDAIAKDAGVTKQLVYHYFKTKEELYGVVLDRVAEEMRVLLEDPDYEILPPPEALRRFAERVHNALLERPYMVAVTLDQGLHRGQHVSRRSQYIPTVKQFIANSIQPILERGASQGVFRANVDPFLFYWTAFAILSAVFMQRWDMSSTTEIAFDGDAGIALWNAHSIDFILRALRP